MQDKGNVVLQKASALRQHVGHEGLQLNSSRHEMHASMQQTVEQLSASMHDPAAAAAATSYRLLGYCPSILHLLAACVLHSCDTGNLLV